MARRKAQEPQPPEPDRWIAERSLHRRDGGEVVVRIGAPYAAPDGHDEFHCAVQVTGLLDGDLTRRIVGGDSMQALLLAAVFAGRVVTDPALGLSWFDGLAELGFPRIDPAGHVDLVIGDGPRRS